MSVTATDALLTVPFARASRIAPSLAPTHFGYQLVTVNGDATGGTVSLHLEAPGGFFHRLEAVSVFASDAAADVGELRMRASVDWLQDSLPILTVIHQSAMPFVQFSTTQSFNDSVAMSAWIQQVRRLPLGRLNGQLSEDALLALLESNVNGQSYSMDVWTSAWELPSLGLPGFMNAFHGFPDAVPA